jgi:predicted nuclease with RNAse H fold
VRSLGIDVGVRKGLDLVLLDETLAPAATLRRVEVDHLSDVLDELRPDVLAVDAPPGWGVGGGSRGTERELRVFGIQSFGTPSDEAKGEQPFYEWMKVGFRVFHVAAGRGFPRYASGSVRGTAIEVFPHASAVVLAGCLPPPSVSKRTWRAAVLASQGVAVGGLRSTDQIDATLAALTGLLALKGRRTALGDPVEGVIVLPAASLPRPPYRRCAQVPKPDPQARLPGMSPCACGDPECTALTQGEFARGHDAKRKSRLWARARLGDEAAQELRRRGWELPPEMR